MKNIKQDNREIKIGDKVKVIGGNNEIGQPTIESLINLKDVATAIPRDSQGNAIEDIIIPDEPVNNAEMPF